MAAATTSASRKPSSNPKTLDMLVEAISNLNDRKGASVQAIKTYIIDKYPTVDPNMLRFRLKKALKKGLESGVISRPKSSEQNGASLNGRFKIDKAKLAAQEKSNKPKAKTSGTVTKAAKPKVKPNASLVQTPAKKALQKAKATKAKTAAKAKAAKSPKDKAASKGKTTPSKTKKDVKTKKLTPKDKPKKPKARKMEKSPKAKGAAKSKTKG